MRQYRDGWRDTLARYPRLVTCMIEESLGYFTPQMAVKAIQAHKTGGHFGCEWYSHIASCKYDKPAWDEEYRRRMKEINHDVISLAFERRKYFNKPRARQVVNMNLNGGESVFASWF